MNPIAHRDVLTNLLGSEMSPLISSCVARYAQNGNGKDSGTVMLQSIMDAINAVAVEYEHDVFGLRKDEFLAMMRCLKIAYMGARVISQRRGAVG